MFSYSQVVPQGMYTEDGQCLCLHCSYNYAEMEIGITLDTPEELWVFINTSQARGVQHELINDFSEEEGFGIQCSDCGEWIIEPVEEFMDEDILGWKKGEEFTCRQCALENQLDIWDKKIKEVRDSDEEMKGKKYTCEECGEEFEIGK